MLGFVFLIKRVNLVLKLKFNLPFGQKYQKKIGNKLKKYQKNWK